MLKVNRISKSFGGIRALSNISFKVPERAIFGIMGANGAGKTTLFAVIAGNQLPTSGEVWLNERRLTGLAPHHVASAGVARTFQIVRPFRGLTVQENIRIAFSFGSGNRSEANQLSETDLLSFMGMERFANYLAGDLTLSQQKRLEMARALATAPQMLLLDEVMAGLTATEVQDLIEMIRKMRAELGITVMIIEHVMGALMTLSDQIMVLDHGQKIAEGTPSSIAQNPDVQSAYLGVA
ncbi:MAG: ABC transporter ATP-binding protein [Rhodospirillaceae bacterium]|nr:ABC transporter ATP-binding protein [Rhodospirillaceae bacterium]MCY4237673.1 ABC transporter ATP-binding protein [Rhodospirillaceae bacterium]